MESALVGCPTVIAYRVAAPTYWFAKAVVKIPFIGIVNIIANRLICPEFIQNDATSDALANALIPLLGDTPERAAMLAGYAEVRALLGDGGAATRAAAIVASELPR